MKVYLFISKHKKTLKMYLPYIEALQQKFDITGNLVDADIVMILGAWTRQGAQSPECLARWASPTSFAHSATSQSATAGIRISSAVCRP